MNTAEFGQLVKQKYPQYQDVPDEELANKVIAKYPVYQNKVQASPYDASAPGSPLMKTLAKVQTNLGTSNTLPALYGLLGSIITAGNPVGTGVFAGGGQALKQQVAKSLNPSTTIEGLGGIYGVTPPTLSDVGGIAKTGVEAGLSQFAFNKLLGGLSWLSKPKVYGKAVQATEEAGAAGKSINYENVVQNAKDYLSSKGTPLAERKLAEVASRFAPNSIESTMPNVAKGIPEAFSQPPQTLDPRRALEVRGQLTKSIPSGFFGKLGTSLADIMQGQGAAAERAATTEATNALRQSLSSEIHSVVPKTITPDKFYSFWSRLGGDLPTWGKRILAEELIRRVVPGPWKSTVKQALPTP